MSFETNLDVLNWYEKQPQTITKEFMESIAWEDVKKFPLDKNFIPVLIYMRDVETLTEMYHQELMRTPTGKDKVISKFMDRWGNEELVHGELINRFLNEAGFETSKIWQSEMKKEVSWSYKANAYVSTLLTNCIGKKFTGVHMTFGAINEMSTLQGYRRLIKLANHPVLTQILRGIMREESAHTQFYWHIARLELQKSEFAQKLARFVIRKFWSPVGQGAKAEKDSNYTIKTLFGDQEGLAWVDKNITQKLHNLPGFSDLNTITERISQISAIKV
jgi:tRNA isopentenyl-2-thiomethyl-A-37 hydroxylase MiaE